MPSLERVIARLDIEPDFAAALERDPREALAPYDLTLEELRALAAVLDGRRRRRTTSISALLLGSAGAEPDGNEEGSG